MSEPVSPAPTPREPGNDEVADLEYDATIPPRPEEDVADAIRNADDRPRHLDG